MDFKIEEISDLSGKKAKVYSVILEGENETLIEQFFDENRHHKDIGKVYARIKSMADDTGCKRWFFKEGEGKLGDGMVALDKTGTLRLYGIYFHDAVVLLGSGGNKPPEVDSWQHCPTLSPKGYQMEAIAEEVNKRIREGILKITPEGILEE